MVINSIRFLWIFIKYPQIYSINKEIVLLKKLIAINENVNYHQERLTELETDLFFMLASKSKKQKLYNSLCLDMTGREIENYFKEYEQRLKNMCLCKP